MRAAVHYIRADSTKCHSTLPWAWIAIDRGPQWRQDERRARIYVGLDAAASVVKRNSIHTRNPPRLPAILCCGVSGHMRAADGRSTARCSVAVATASPSGSAGFDSRSLQSAHWSSALSHLQKVSQSMGPLCSSQRLLALKHCFKQAVQCADALASAQGCPVARNKGRGDTRGCAGQQSGHRRALAPVWVNAVANPALPLRHTGAALNAHSLRVRTICTSDTAIIKHAGDQTPPLTKVRSNKAVHMVSFAHVSNPVAFSSGVKVARL